MPLPPPLLRDGSVAVVAPASAPPDPDAYRAGLAALRERGLHVEAPETIRPFGYLAGPDAVRLEALNAALARPDLDAIFCARGGYGVLRLLPDVDYDAAAAHPKLLIGYSDITALQLALYARAGVPSLSGPMVAPDWPHMDDEQEAWFWALAGGEAPFTVSNPGGALTGGLQEGSAEGVLLGGNLTMLCALLSTPYMPDLDGALLFVEEVGEAPYRVDRLFAQLRLAGVLDRIGGLILGAFTGSDPQPGRPSLPLREVIRHYAGLVNGPVAAGLVYGHLRPKAILPIGVRARLTVDEPGATLTVLDPLTASASE